MVAQTQSYSEKLRHPLWQKRRLQIMERAAFKCEKCGSPDNFLNVHHKLYRPHTAPWNYADNELACLCEDCHLIGHLRDGAMAREQETALEEMIEGAYVILSTTKDHGSRVCAARVMAGLIALRSPATIKRMERERGLARA